MKLVILGPQGSGKGTQAAMLVDKYGLSSFAMGDALREKANEDSPTGKAVKEILDQGKLVPNEITDRIIKEFIEENGSWIVDGYPRNMGQAEFFDSIADPDIVLVLELDDTTAIERLGGRRVCAEGHNYHVNYKPPKEKGVCDIDGKVLKQRHDDTPEAIRERLKIYHDKTRDVIGHYEDRILRIDGNPSIEEVHHSIVKELEERDLC